MAFDIRILQKRIWRYLHGHFEIALYVDTFEAIDKEYARIADPEGNLIEIGSFDRSFDHR